MGAWLQGHRSRLWHILRRSCPHVSPFDFLPDILCRFGDNGERKHEWGLDFVLYCICVEQAVNTSRHSDVVARHIVGLYGLDHRLLFGTDPTQSCSHSQTHEQKHRSGLPASDAWAALCESDDGGADQATYIISLLVQLRTTLPGDDSLLSSLPDFRVFGRLFDLVFLSAACFTLVYKFIASKVN